MKPRNGQKVRILDGADGLVGQTATVVDGHGWFSLVEGTLPDGRGFSVLLDNADLQVVNDGLDRVQNVMC